jgi:hypothetical protein
MALRGGALRGGLVSSTGKSSSGLLLVTVNTVNIAIALVQRLRIIYIYILNARSALWVRGMALLICCKPVPAASINPRALSVRILEKRHSLPRGALSALLLDYLI